MSFVNVISDYQGSYVRDEGHFYPSNAGTTRTNQFLSYKKGMLLSIGNLCYVNYGSGLAPNAVQPNFYGWYDPGYIGAGFNTDTWASQSAAAGIKYCYLTVFEEWLLYDSDVVWPAPTQSFTMSATPAGGNPFTMPTHRKYDNGSAQRFDPSFLYRFCNSMRKYGVEPGFYLNICDSVNHIGGGSQFVPVQGAQYWITYLCLIIQEMLTKYGVKLLWFDNAFDLSQVGDPESIVSSTPYVFHQQLYDAVKAVSPDCLVNMSNNLNIGFAHGFPSDICSTEEEGESANQVTGSIAQFRNVTLTAGTFTNFYTPCEVVAPIYTGSNYFKSEPNLGTNNFTVDIGLPGRYTIYQKFGANMLFGVALDTNGLISNDQLNAISVIS